MAGRRSPAPQACWTCLHVTHKPEARAKETAGEPSWCRKLPSLALQACVASGLELGEERFSSRSRYTITPWPWRFGDSRYKPEAPAKEPCSSLMHLRLQADRSPLRLRFRLASRNEAEGVRRWWRKFPSLALQACVASGQKGPLRWRFRLVSQADKKGPLRLRFRVVCGQGKREHHDE